MRAYTKDDRIRDDIYTYMNKQRWWNITYTNANGEEQLYSRHHMTRWDACDLLKKLHLSDQRVSFHSPDCDERNY